MFIKGLMDEKKRDRFWVEKANPWDNLTFAGFVWSKLFGGKIIIYSVTAKCDPYDPES